MTARDKKRLYFPFFENIHGKKDVKLEPLDTAFHLLTIENVDDEHSLFKYWIEKTIVEMADEYKKYKYKAFVKGGKTFNVLHILSKSYQELVKLGIYLNAAPRSRSDISLYLYKRDFLVAHEDVTLSGIVETKNNLNTNNLIENLKYHTKVSVPSLMWPTQPRLGRCVIDKAKNNELPPRIEDQERYSYKIDFSLDYCKISLYHKDLKKLLEAIEIVFYKCKCSGKVYHEDTFIIDRLEEEEITVKRSSHQYD